MKRIVLGLVMLSGLAIGSASRASAAAPGLCGHSYAMLLTGAESTLIQQDGTATQPGALTHTVGVGVITFGSASGNTCSSIAGELIYNSGDLQSNGTYFGPASCYGGTIPCFDGGNHFSGGTLTNPGPNGNGSMQLSFSAGFTWYNGSAVSCSAPLSFTIQNTLGSFVVVGTSVPPPSAGPDVRGKLGVSCPIIPVSIVTLTMQKIGTVPVAAPATPGTAPYLGLESVNCQSLGANQSDPVSVLVNPPGFAGEAGSAVGAVQTFANGEAGGSISYNTNDNIAASGTPSNNDCAIQVFPGTTFGGTYAFPDGTSNTVALYGTSGFDCTNFPGTGYANSAVQWGATDTQSYLTMTGLLTAAGGFEPPAEMSTCTTYYNVPAGSITNLMVPKAFIAPDSGSSSGGYIKLTNTSPADCDVTATLTGTTTDGNCSVSVAPHLGVFGLSASNDVPGNTPLTQYFDTECTCASEDASPGVSATMTLTSTRCPLSGVVAHTPITCSN